MISRSEKIRINREMRQKDDSHLYPIFGQFNATNRAIRKLAKFARVNGEFSSAIEYEHVLDCEITKIVNDPRLG